MKFCSHCGNPVSQKVPEGDNRLRHVCDHCQTIHYQNPRIVAGCLPVWGRRVLLCRRAIHPRYGFWTLPAGFMENGETVEQAARRETYEEACARVGELQLYTLFDLPHINQVYMLFRGELADPDFAQMLKLGVKMEDAYKARYFDDIMARRTTQTAKTVEKGVEARIRQRGARPAENGTNPGGAAVLKTDVSKLTPQQCEELERRAMRGQIITF